MLTATPDILLDPISINADFPHPNNDHFLPYLQSVEQAIRDLIKKHVGNEPINIHSKLPLIICSDTPSLPLLPTTLSFILLTHGRFSSGIDTYFADMISRWLVPGKQLEILANRSLSFRFLHPHLQNRYFFNEIFVHITQEKELYIAKKNMPQFLNELTLNISAVNKSKFLLSTNQPPQNSSTLFNSDDIRKTHDMQTYLQKVSTEKKLSDITENLSRIMERRPKIFDKDIFYSIHNISLLFKGNFTLTRNTKHISRLIALYYIFSNHIRKSIKSYPGKRHIHFKIIKTKNSTGTSVIGILLSFNLLQETEKFENLHFKQTIESILGKVTYIPDSYISDKNDEKVRTFYIEIAHNELITKELMNKLHKNLPQEVNAHVENPIHPIFMPRNDEEIFRNIVFLSKQLKYLKDIPQVIISYEKQTSEQICFIIILIRLLKEHTLSLKELFLYSQLPMTYVQDDVKIIGYLKKKAPKELNIFHLFLDKKPFFRKNFTLDLQKARQVVAESLEKIIGPYRDFNGGMILKQNEILKKLKKSINQENNESLIENFFYSLSPSTMKNILPLNILKANFEAYIKALNSQAYIWQEDIDKYALTIIKATTPEQKKHMLNMEMDKTKIISSFIETNNIVVFSYMCEKEYKEQLLKLLKITAYT
jgi:hypothetical protein